MPNINELTNSQRAEPGQEPEAKKDWRFYVGTILFVLSLILPLLAIALVTLLGLSPAVGTVVIGASTAGGPDVLLLAAAAIMGKENLEYLFSKLGRWFKDLVKWDQVSRRRYQVGCWMLVLSLLVSLASFYIFPSALRTGDQLGWSFYVAVGADILFIISFFVLGAEFWAKIHALFHYNVRVAAQDGS